MKLSIITINRNNAAGLKKTMESVFAQTSKNFEYIVIDGASIDNSIEIIKQLNNSTFQHFKCISEPDKGIYNAMNKGIHLANGKYLLFLNSGDWLAEDNVIENVLPFFDDDSDIISGELVLVKENENVKLSPPSQVNLNYCIKSGLTHPNTFIKKTLFDKYGCYNENNKIVSDWEFFLIACGLNKCKYKGIPVTVSYFTMDGISVQNEALVQQETKAALKRILPLWKKTERLIRK